MVESNNIEKSLKPRIIILSPTVSQPRFHRRAAMLLEAGYDITVYAFQRGYYEQNTYPREVDVVSLGEVEEGKYLNRIPKLLKAVSRIKSSEKQHKIYPDFLYAFGLDMALIGQFSFPRNMPMVYEIGDIQCPLPHKTIVEKIIGIIERKILDRCRLLILTSPGFLTDYFKILRPDIHKKVLIIENKMDRGVGAKFTRPQTPKAVSKPIKIGYIGAFKYEDCIFPLIESISKRKGDFELHFYGDGPIKKAIQESAAKYSNIFYHGSFSSTQDLHRIYETVDLSYVVYDNLDPNVRMALPNKLYDGPYFGVPLVVAENTLLASRVREQGIGLVVNPQKDGFAEELLDVLTPELVCKLSGATLKLDLNLLVESYEKIIPVFKQLSIVDRDRFDEQ